MFLTPAALSAGDLLLRPFEEGDEAAVATALDDDAILRWAAGNAATSATRQERAAVWLRLRIGGWALGNAVFAVTGTGGLLGCVSVREFGRLPGQCPVSYWVTPEARGRGVAARALDAAARWAFADPAGGGLGLHRLNLDHALVNAGSCRVAAKAGFRLEGTMRDAFIDPAGRWHDCHLHARLATDRP